MNLQSKLGYLPPKLALCKRDGITDRRTDKRTDGRTIRLLDASGGPFMPGHKKKSMFP